MHVNDQPASPQGGWLGLPRGARAHQRFPRGPRNDLGVVYLDQRRLDDARFEFMTAIELKQSDQLAAVNLVTLLIYQDNWEQAAKVVGQLGLSPDQVTRAQARAQHLKEAGTAPQRPVKDQVAAVSDTLPASVK